MPASFSLPVVLLLLVAGLLACFAGYRLFRLVLGLYGFLLGAAVAVALFASQNAFAVLVAALVGGLLGAALLTVAYFAGVALAGGALGALFAHVVWAGARGSAPGLIIFVFAVAGAVLALVFQRYVIIVATAFGGAWTTIVAALALAGGTAGVRAARGVLAGSWTWLPSTSAHGVGWLTLSWLVLGLVGTLVQIGATAGPDRRRR